MRPLILSYAKVRFSSLLLGLLMVMGLIPPSVFAASAKVCPEGMSQLDCAAIYGNWANWIPETGTSSSCAEQTLTDSVSGDNPSTAYAFFRAAGLDDMHAAAVYGNLYQESAGMDPLIMQKGGESKNPADADPLGWGLVQWSPGSKVIGIAQNYGITDPIYELTTQLSIVLKEMKDVSPAGVQNTFDGLNKQTTLEDAVNYFMVNFEAAGTSGPRLAYAQDGMQKFGGQDYTVTAGGGCISSTLSPDCQSAAGSAKILCAAKSYDAVSYSETTDAGHQGGAAWHDSCPIVGPNCILDCSGLVNIAVYDAFGVDLRETTDSERTDNKYWQTISFSQLQPGDLIQPGSYDGSHVEIVDHVVGNTVYTFGAHTSHVPQADQVSSNQYAKDSADLYLHFTGSRAQ